MPRATRRTIALGRASAVTFAVAVVVAAIGVAAVAPPAGAQRRLVAARAEADNDAFAFWRPPWDRSDDEYTSGVRGTLEFAGPSRFLRAVRDRIPGLHASWFPGGVRRAVLRAVPDSAPSSVVRSVGVGQAIFTGPRADSTSDPAMPRRPNGAWLYAEIAERDSSPDRSASVSVAFGVVGPPALGEAAQRLFHSLAPEFQRPVDWSRQLPFEPAFVVRYNEERRGTRWTPTRGMPVRPYASYGGAVGTIVTEAAIGGGLRGELGDTTRRRAWMPTIHVDADVRFRLVLRDEFLDGTFFRRSEHVARRPFLAERGLSVTARWGQLALAFRSRDPGRQYSGQRSESGWSTLRAEWRLAR